MRRDCIVALLGLVAWATACASGPTSAVTRDSRLPPATPAGSPMPPASTAPAIVRVSHTQGLAGPLQIAEARGYFGELGIELRREEFASTGEAVLPLSTGQLDVASATPTAAFFNALARGIRLYIVLAGSHVDPRAGGFPFMVRATPDGPAIRSLADLQGKRIAQNQRGVIMEWELERMLAAAGMQPADVDIIVMPFPDVLAAFGGGTVDGAILPEAYGAIAEERGLAVRLVNAGEYTPGAQVAAMVYSERFAREQTPVARRWAVAYLRATRDFMDAMEYGRDRDEILGILAEASRVELPILQRAGYFPVRRDGRPSGHAIQAMLDWLADRGYVPQKPDLAPLLDLQFADYAARLLDGKAIPSDAN